MQVHIEPYPLKPGAKRKEFVKIERGDVGDLFSTLALVILPALVRFKRHTNGIPNSFIDYSHHAKLEWGSKKWRAAEKRASDRGWKEWNAALDKMIYSFGEIVNEDDNDEPNITKFKNKDKRRRLHEAYQNRVAEGLELFGKHFQALWI